MNGTMRALRTALLLGSGFCLVAPALVRAEPPPANSGTEPRRGAAEREERRRELAERLRERFDRAAQAGSALPLPRGLPSSVPTASASASSSAPLPSAIEAMRAHWREFSRTRGARREQHRREARSTIGDAIREPAVRAELARHADRAARLRRAAILAEGVADAAARERTVARVRALEQRELDRHRKELARLTAHARSLPSAAAMLRAGPSAAPTGSTP